MSAGSVSGVFFVGVHSVTSLFSFFYASLHAGNYFFVDQELIWRYIWQDIGGTSHLVLGLMAYLGLTSTVAMVRRLGRHWIRLH